jgi:hypothetical protein
MADKYTVTYTIPSRGSGVVTTSENANSESEAKAKVQNRVKGCKVLGVTKAK